MHSASYLAAALRQNGITMSVVERTKLNVRPRSALTKELAELVKYFKPELVRLLRDEPETGAFQPVACPGCDAEFVRHDGDRCAWCLSVGDSPLYVEPNSPKERALLRLLENCPQLSPAHLGTVQTVPTPLYA